MSDRQFRDFCVAYDPHMSGSISYTQFNNQVGELIQPTNHGLVVRRLGKHKKRPRNAAVTAAGGAHDLPCARSAQLPVTLSARVLWPQ